MSIFKAMAEGTGKLWNAISGKTASQEFAAAEAEKQRNWEEHMSNTAFQRGSADMEKAGLNAAMMYSGGSGGGGASTPHGAAATGNQNGSDSLSGLINSAANLARAFNYDKDSSNNVNIYQVSDKVKEYMKRNGYKTREEMNKSFFTDLDKVKI